VSVKFREEKGNTLVLEEEETGKRKRGKKRGAMLISALGKRRGSGGERLDRRKAPIQEGLFSRDKS